MVFGPTAHPWRDGGLARRLSQIVVRAGPNLSPASALGPPLLSVALSPSSPAGVAPITRTAVGAGLTGVGSPTWRTTCPGASVVCDGLRHGDAESNRAGPAASLRVARVGVPPSLGSPVAQCLTQKAWGVGISPIVGSLPGAKLVWRTPSILYRKCADGDDSRSY
jgi:hypothetical protein